MVYVFVALPLTVLEFVVTVMLWSATLALLSMPLWFASSGFGPAAGTSPISPFVIGLIGGAVGLALAPVAASVSRGLMALHRAVVAGLLCDSGQRALERRVETLEGSRKAVLDVEASELRRIERDLHDGAQQRLVMLTIDLSLAAERIDTDPASARTLVVEAQDQARQALAELRDLVRGIAPSILLDRGLVPALSSIAGPLPGADGRREHAARRRAPAGRGRAGGLLRGRGGPGQRRPSTPRAGAARSAAGARASGSSSRSGTTGPVARRVVPGGGLAGLAGRVEALDGTLTVESPPGGPTLVRAEVPVAALPASRGPGSLGRPAVGRPAAPVRRRPRATSRGRSAPPARGGGRSASRAARACRRCC